MEEKNTWYGLSTDSDEFVETLEYSVDSGQEPLRIDKFLMLRIERASRNKIQNAAHSGSILVNDKAVKPNYKVKPGDAIKVILPKKNQEYKLEPENIPLNIVYEDDYLIVVNKQAGLVVHPSIGHYSGTLINALLYHVQNLPVKDDNSRPGLIHRLDKDTSGLMVIAKEDYTMTHLAKQFFDRTIKRTYQALVWNEPEPMEGKIDVHLGRDLRHRKRMAAFPEADYGKHAVTNYKTIERFGYTTLVECRLETGRTHQIRVHMKHVRCPIFNDSTYGGNTIVKGTIYTKYKQFVDNCFKTCTRQALHAKSLGFEHPQTGEELFFESDLPDDMHQLIDKWRRYTSFTSDRTEE